jgi:hypothetical protein
VAHQKADRGAIGLFCCGERGTRTYPDVFDRSLAKCQYLFGVGIGEVDAMDC